MSAPSRLRLLVWFLAAPWPDPLRFRLLRWLLGWTIHPSARLSRLAVLAPERARFGQGCSIAAGCVVIHLAELVMEESACIGRSCWITGHPAGASRHFAHVAGRDPSLRLGRHASITKRHLIDCSHQVAIGAFATIAGYGSQILTHGIDYRLGRQDCAPVSIGDYTLIGTGCIILGGAQVPDRAVIAAGAVVVGRLPEPQALYTGVPATLKKRLPDGCAYFSRSDGFVP